MCCDDDDYVEPVHATHCSRCVFTGDQCTANEQCPIVACPTRCGARMHQCKVEEHTRDICSGHVVSCINATYGCRVRMIRQQLGPHLAHCPAAVIQCNMERSRRLLRAVPKSRPADHQCNCEANLDLCLALSDQRKLNSAQCAVAEPALCEQQGASPVARECYLCKQDPGGQHLHVLGSMGAVVAQPRVDETPKKRGAHHLPPFYTKHHLFVGLDLQFLPRPCAKPADWATWSCGQLMRRDEYSEHVQSFHADVINSLDGWLLARCPMYNQGCDVVASRLVPSHGQLSYSFWADTVVLKGSASDEEAREMAARLDDMPFEVLENICCYLDGNSMHSLSMTNCRMREISRRQLNSRGFVEYLWTRKVEPGAGWRSNGTRWRFSRCFRPAKKWNVIPAGKIIDHLQCCPYKNPVAHQKNLRIYPELP